MSVKSGFVFVWVALLVGASMASCSGGGGTGGDDMGTGEDGSMGQCDTADDCTVNACSVATCEASRCVVTPIADGPPPSIDQIGGDCQRIWCVAGQVRNQNDDSDTPSGNSCATGSCSGGVPIVTPAPLGTACDEVASGVCNGDSQAPACVGCNAPADCTALPADDECQTRTCVDHVCGQSFTAAGTPVALQTPRDCQELQCDGAGGVTAVADDADLPDDHNDCTDDVCTGGTPSHPTLDNGTACGDGTLSCDGTGQCVGCVDPAQCGDETFCATNTCTLSVCGRALTTAGTVAPAAEQEPGDCQTLVCDGDGGLAPIPEDTDLPQDDGDECTAQTCVDGAPMFPPAPIDTPCASGGSYCNGSGACVGCTTGAHCGTDTACVRYVCVNNGCSVLVSLPGTAIPGSSQVTGDCQVLSCGPAGGVQSTPDDADVPVDDNDCTDDVCTSGVPSHPPVNAGGACGDGSQMCTDDGRCVSCFDASDCAGGTFCGPRACVAGSCVTAPLPPGTPLEDDVQTPGDCQRMQCDGAGGEEVVADNTDVPSDTNNECTAASCDEGVPGSFPLPTGTGCSVGGDVCDGTGACVECNANAECGPSTDCRIHTCVNHVCQVQDVAAGTPIASQTAGDCQEVRCNGSGGTTSVALNSDTPNDQNECTADTCNAGTPESTPTPNASCGAAGICNAGGQCVGCNTAADCGTDSFCRSYACVANTCEVTNTAPNTPLPAGSQVAADCSTLVCDGAGGTTTTPDPVDVPADDGNECTVSACSNGTPTQNPTTLGVPCNNGAGLCNGNGACVECLAASDCGFDSFCAQFACVNNTCQQTNTAAGTDLPAGSQTPLDCQVLECDGAGNQRSVALNSDVPVDGNPCTSDVCSAGVPSNPPTAVNSACNVDGGTVCNGSGQCVECNAAAQCGTNTFCQAFTCTNGECGTAPTSVGTPLPGQTAGDCQELQCNGMGGTRSVASDADLPDDGNECTDDICSLGVPMNPNRVVNSGCDQNGGTYCNGAGACVACNAASQCGTNTFCAQFTCMAGACGVTNTAAGTDLPGANQTSGDCQVLECNGMGAVRSVALNSDVPVDGNQCTNDVCSAGVPSNPNRPLNFACGTGDFCNGSGACVDCNAASQCGTDTFCQAFTCISNNCGTTNTAAGTDLPGGSQSAGDCQVLECNGMGAVRSVALDSDLPVDGNQCTEDVCSSGVPSNPPSPALAMCSMGGDLCDGAGNCVDCVSAADCGTNTFCQTFTCNAGTCQTNNTTAGVDLPAGSQTAGDCQVLECNGMGAVRSVALNSDLPVDGNQCTNDVCTAGVPSNPNRPLNFACGTGDFCNGSGTCVDCTAASQCGTNTFCQAFTCNSNTCGVNNTAAGTDLPGGNQTAGDCQVLECDGMGMTRSVALNSDLPVDGNTCTSDVCSAGVPSNPPVAAGAMCAMNGGSYCNGASQCVECLSAADCGASTFCHTFTCNAGTCGETFASNGTTLPMGSQTAGDCQSLVCNGAGAVVSVALNSDLPNDGNACTSDTCSMGTPTFTNVPNGQACGMAGMCQSGNCVGCAVASDCGVSNFCVTYTCNANSCGVVYTPNGTALPAGSQTAGNCQTLVCDGAGATISIAANGDVPVDGNPCTNDVCTAGAPSNPPTAINTACGSGDFCNGAGSCVDCNSASQCGTDTFCQTFTCNSNTCGVSNTANGTVLPMGSQTAGDCRELRCNGAGGTTNAVFNSDLPVDGNPCTNDVCSAGTPSNPPAAINTACGSGDFCNGAGSCVDCTSAAQCGTSTFCQTFTCNSNTCGVSNTPAGTDLPGGSQVAGDCHVVECNGAGGTMNTVFNADVPVDGNPCTNDVCSAGTPSNPNSAINTACGSGDFCNGAGSCVDCNSAAQCGTSTFCQTFTCNSNTCGVSNTANGTPLPGGSQVTGDCREQRCNGAGGTTNAVLNSDLPVDGNDCTGDVCSAGTPSNPPLAVDTPCGSGDFCNGSGTCVDCNNAAQCGTTTFCRTYTCNSNTCGFSNTANGTDLPPGDQTAGDCRVWECNGAGSAVNNVFNSDVPVDGNPCTNDVCSAGTPSNPNSAINTPCGTGDYCNGAGSCVDCTTSTQCPTGNQCQGRTCTGNTCGLTNLANGTSCNDGLFCTQTDTCNGFGSCTGSGNPCNQCQTCNDISNTCPSRPNFTACNDGLFCTQTDFCFSGSCNGSGNPCDSQCETCNEATNLCNDRANGTVCSTLASGRDNVCHVEQCSTGVCGRRINRFLLPGTTFLTSGGSPASYPTAISATAFNTCTACHSVDPPGNFSFSEAWSESTSYTVFDDYCANWGSNANRFFYGANRAGCTLYLLDAGIMPASGGAGSWAYDDEYLNWYCSSAGPGGAAGW